MSRLWSRRAQLRIEPARVQAALGAPGSAGPWMAIARRLHLGASEPRRVIQAQRDALEPGTRAAAIDEVLRELAAQPGYTGADLDVEVADALFQLDVVAGDFAGDSDHQLMSVAMACAGETLGDALQAHEIRWHLQTDGRHLLIAAIDRELITCMGEAAARHGFRLRSVQPDLCLQWFCHADAALKLRVAVFAVACGRDVVVACTKNGVITAISHGAWLDRQGNADALDARVDRLLASAGLDAAAPAACVLVPPEGVAPTVSARWTVKPWGVHAS